jgi:hypothetical protein
MKEIWSRFDVTITDADPGAEPHIEALFARAPADVGITTNVGGISPFSLSCSVIEGSIVFAFTDSLPKTPRAICEVMSQEIAHSYGLDHELLAADPMTYLPYSGSRAFQDHDAQCGETTARPCGIAGSTCRATQNSVQLLLSRLGAADEDPDLGEALDRWELSLFQDGPFAAEQRREALVALLGGTDGLWAAIVRGAILLGENGRERADVQARLSDDPSPDLVRRALVETLLRGDRAALVRMLDETILGLRPAPAARPPSVARALAS